MKIALLNNLYSPYARGGAEQVVARALEELRAAGQTVFLITTRPRNPKQRNPELEKKIAGEDQVYYLSSGYYNLATYPTGVRLVWQILNLFNLRKYYQIKKILRAEKPDLVYTHNLMGLGFLTPILLRHLKIRQQHYLHDVQALHPSGLLIYRQEKKIFGLAARIYQAATRFLFGSPEKIISPSAWLLKQHQDRNFFPRSLSEIKKTDLKSDCPNPPLKPWKKFIFVGQIENHKGIFLLLKAFKNIPEPGISLTIVGDGQAWAQAREQAGNDARVRFLGRQTLTEVQKILGQHQALIIPSICYENAPTIVPLAQARGLGIIASDLGGLPEMLRPSDYLFKPEAPQLETLLKSLIK